MKFHGNIPGAPVPVTAKKASQVPSLTSPSRIAGFALRATENDGERSTLSPAEEALAHQIALAFLPPRKHHAFPGSDSANNTAGCGTNAASSGAGGEPVGINPGYCTVGPPAAATSSDVLADADLPATSTLGLPANAKGDCISFAARDSPLAAMILAPVLFYCWQLPSIAICDTSLVCSTAPNSSMLSG
jgi:hypothetical protein